MATLSFLRAEALARRPDAQVRFDFDVDRGVVGFVQRGIVRTIIILEPLQRRSAPKFEAWGLHTQTSNDNIPAQ